MCPNLVSNSAPITADAATAKTVGVGKTITYNAKAKVKKVTVKNKKIVTAKKSGKKVTLKGKKAGKTTVTIKTTKKTIKLTVKVGATSITKKSLSTTMTAGKTQTIKVNAVNGKGDTVKFTSSNKAVVKVNKASAVANKNKVASTTVTALKAGTAKITATSMFTGKKKAFTIKVAADTVAPTPTTTGGAVVTTPGVSTTPTATNPSVNPGGNSTNPPQTTTGTSTTVPAASEDPDVTTNPAITGDPTETQDPNATKDPNATQNPNATQDPSATDTPDVSTNPAITTEPAVTTNPAVEFAAKQIGDKKIKITNPTAMTKSDISIKRGTSALTINSVTFNSDATEAEVTLAGSIIAVDYTITVGEKTYTLKGEASEVADIQITSDYAPIKGEIGGTDADAKTATATYVVYNQFGENVTAKTSLTANTSAADIVLNPTEGTMTITWASAPRLNDVVSVVLMYQATGLSATKILSVQSKSTPSEVEVYGLYNTDGKTLTATNVSKESFYFLYRVKDQYGNYMNNVTDVSGTSAVQNLFPTVSSGMTNVTLETDNRQTITVDGVNYFGYAVRLSDDTKAATAGKVTVMLIPGGSGKTVTTEFAVENGSTVKTFNVVVDSSVASGGSKVLSYVALDENGDEVTDYRVLKEVRSSSNKFYWQKANGTVELVFDDARADGTQTGATSAGSTVSTVFTLPSYQTVLVNVKIGEPAVPASISGIDSEVALAARNGESITIGFDKLSILDQYGNKAVTSKFVANAANVTAADDGKLGVMLVEEDTSNANFDSTAGSLSYKDNGTANIIGTNESFTIRANNDGKLGSESFTFKLVKYSSTDSKWVDYESEYTTTAKVNFTQTGAFTSTFVVTTDKNFVSYEVNTIDAIYDNGTKPASAGKYTPAVTVKGVLKSGVKVNLDASKDFKVVPVSNLDTVADVTNGTTNLCADATYEGTATTATGKYKVVINYTGETIEKTVKIDKAVPTTATIKFKGEQKGINCAVGDLTNVSQLVADLKAVDSYGVDASKITAAGVINLADSSTTEQIKFTITDIDTVDGKVTNNGTKDVAFTGFAAGDSFTVTFTAGTASFSTVVSLN